MPKIKVQWDVIWSVLRTLLVAGGPMATLLIALGFPAVQVSTWLGIGLAAVGVASVLVPGLVGALKQTDAAKVQMAEAVPGVATVVIKDTANGTVSALALSDAHPNIVTESQNAFDAKKGTRAP